MHPTVHCWTLRFSERLPLKHPSSLQLKISIWADFLKCISVWSKTLDHSSVFLQLVQLKSCHQWWILFSFIISQAFDIVIYDICCKKRSKTKPVCFCGIKEPIESVLWTPFLKRASPLLHIHASPYKNVAKFVTKQRNRQNNFFFHLARGFPTWYFKKLWMKSTKAFSSEWFCGIWTWQILHYIKRNRFMPFLLAEIILNF